MSVLLNSNENCNNDSNISDKELDEYRSIKLINFLRLSKIKYDFYCCKSNKCIINITFLDPCMGFRKYYSIKNDFIFFNKITKKGGSGTISFAKDAFCLSFLEAIKYLRYLYKLNNIN